MFLEEVANRGLIMLFYRDICDKRELKKDVVVLDLRKLEAAAECPSSPLLTRLILFFWLKFHSDLKYTNKNIKSEY